jgi:type II secretory pathway component PulF
MQQFALRFGAQTGIFGGVGLSLSQKRNLYHGLAQLLRAGKSLPSALGLLATSSSGKLKRFLTSLQKALDEGEPVPEAVARQGASIGAMEISMLSAAGRSGRLAESCATLSNYFQTLEKTRTAILRNSAYPLFVLHFGILLMGVPNLVGAGGLQAYLAQTLATLGIVYGCLLIPLLAIMNLLFLAEKSPLVDRFILAVPGTGKVRRMFSLARFCATYDAMVEAGINVIESVKTAADASRSAVVTQGIARQLPLLRQGAQVGEVLALAGAFPEWMVREFRVAEETGGLDQELPRMASEMEEQALIRVETLSHWLPRLVYIAVLVLMGWKIVSFYQGYYNGFTKLME